MSSRQESGEVGGRLWLLKWLLVAALAVIMLLLVLGVDLGTGAA